MLQRVQLTILQGKNWPYPVSDLRPLSQNTENQAQPKEFCWIEPCIQFGSTKVQHSQISLIKKKTMTGKRSKTLFFKIGWRKPANLFSKEGNVSVIVSWHTWYEIFLCEDYQNLSENQLIYMYTQIFHL